MRINRNDHNSAGAAPQNQPTPAPEAKQEAAASLEREPVKEKKRAPAKAKKHKAKPEPDAEEGKEKTRRRFPFGCLIVLIFLALVAFGGYKVMQFYGEIDGSTELGTEQTVTIETPFGMLMATPSDHFDDVPDALNVTLDDAPVATIRPSDHSIYVIGWDDYQPDANEAYTRPYHVYSKECGNE